jgi:type VI secretion system secreted protein VgrG
MPHAELSFECGESSLSVRRFSIHEAVSQPFTLSVWARAENPAIDIGAIVGQPAQIRITSGFVHVLGGGARTWSGLCSYMELVRGERRPSPKEQSLYYLRIVPTLWLTTHRTGNRIFQHLTIPEIVKKMLDEWRIPHVFRVDAGQTPKHEYRVQYGESDFLFLSRLLEEAGIAYTFDDDGKSTLAFADALHQNQRRGGPPIVYEHNPTQAAEREYVSRVEIVRSVRPGALTIRDYDHRKPAFPLFAEAPKAAAPEVEYEQYHYQPGGMFVEAGKGGDTPHADDKGVARHDLSYGQKRAARMLESLRVDRAGVSFESNVADLAPGVIFSIDNHPHPDAAKEMLVVSTIFEGTAEGEWGVYGHAVFNDVPYRPPLTTPKPVVRGVQVARVVGPVDEEIHMDEYGRIRVQFPWDRDGKFDDFSTCWMRVGEQWGGEAYGFLTLPRVGHEVMISYIEGDPDRPVITGRAYNAVNPVPYVLPDHKTVSTWKSKSYPNADGGWYNEIKYEDQAGEELFYLQAQKNMRVLVKNDESITVGHDRDKYVIGEEEEVTGVNRTQIAGVDRGRMTALNQTAVIGGHKLQRVIGDEREHTEISRMLLVKKSQDIVVKGHRRERVEYDQHLRVIGNRVEHVKKTRSLLVLEEKHEKVGQNFARASGKEHHVVAGEEWVGEATDITLKGPGGFVRIDATGVTISGTFVKINVSGTPGHGHGSHPAEPVEAKEAMIPTGSLWRTGPVQSQAVSKALREKLFTRKKGDKKELGPIAASLMKLAMSHDVSSPPNGAIFWSGGATFAGKAAAALAAQRSASGQASTSLEVTQGGALLGGMTSSIGKDDKTKPNGVDWTEQSPAWRVISQRYARGASGDVTVVVGKVPVGEQAILREEVKTLRANKNVTSIRFFAIKTDAAGAPVDAAGNPLPAGADFVLTPVTAKEVLAAPPPAGAKSPGPPPITPPKAAKTRRRKS